jgi:dipeptidase
MKYKGVFLVALLLLMLVAVSDSFRVESYPWDNATEATVCSDEEGNCWPDCYSCTSVLVTKEASADGSMMTTHSCDGTYEFRLRVVPGGTHQPGEMRPIMKGGGRGADMRQEEKVGEIPQVAQTYSRFDVAYPFMNEKQLAMGETTFGGRRELYNPEGKWDIMALQRIILERTTTAREAIKLMGELVAQDGYGDYGECLTLIDKNEAWLFEIMGAGPLEIGAVWAAKRVPPGEVAVHANRSRIGEVDRDKPDFYMASDNVFTLGEEMGWYDPSSGEPFKFNHVYAPSDSMGSRRREWRVLSTLAPSLNLDPWAEEYPFSVKAEKKVTTAQLKAFHRDHYQGTEFDPAEEVAAGPFANPNRFATAARPPEGYMGWERTISIFRCSYCVVLQTRDWLPDPIGGLAWFAEDDPKTSVFVPMYAGITTVPESFQMGRRDLFDRKSAWWAFDFVSNWANLKYSYMIEDIQKAYTAWDETFAHLQPAVEARAQQLCEEDPQACIAYLTKYSNDMAQAVVDDWWALSDHLVMKYNDGYINKSGEHKSVGYPEEWLDLVGYGKKKILTKSRKPTEDRQ